MEFLLQPGVYRTGDASTLLIVTFARKRQNSAHRPEFGRWALRYMFRYSSITSNIIRAPSLKPF